MKKKLLTLVLAAALCLGLAIPALAALTSKTIEVFTGITIYVDGAEMKPTDANGNPVETFAYNGTTYVPLRAVSQSLGKNVQYDGATQSVYIGDDPRMTNYLVDVCPPYQKLGYFSKSIKMDGVSYPVNGFYFEYSSGYNALFNLDGKYTSLSATVGHLDGDADEESEIIIYLDGQYTQTITLEKECLAKQITIPLNGALQLKIEKSSVGRVGFANAILR